MRNQDAKVFEIIVELNNSDSTLRPAMTTSNNIDVRNYQEVISIPLEALIQDSLPYVIVKRNNKTHKQEVMLGQANENHVIIELGLTATDKVYLFYNADREKLDFSVLGESDKEDTRKKMEVRNTEYQKDMNEKAKNTALYNGKSNESGSSMIIFK